MSEYPKTPFYVHAIVIAWLVLFVADFTGLISIQPGFLLGLAAAYWLIVGIVFVLWLRGVNRK